MAVHTEGPLTTSASGQFNFFFLQQRKTTQVNLQKDLLKNSQAVIKGMALCKMAGVKKREIKVPAKKWL